MARDRATRRQAQGKAKADARDQLESFGWLVDDAHFPLADRAIGRRANHGSFRTPEPWRAGPRIDRPILSERAAVAEGSN